MLSRQQVLSEHQTLQQQQKSSLWELLRPQQLAASVQERHLQRAAEHGPKLTACVPTEMRKVTDP